MPPLLIATVDPDSIRSAIAIARWSDKLDGYRYLGSRGGGTSKTPVPWQTIAGQLELLDELAEEHGLVLPRDGERFALVVETQGADSQWSKAVEPLRRVRYHFEASAELRGVDFKTVAIGSWGPAFVPGARAAGRGAEKKAYMKKAKRLTGGETSNEDRCAAFGMLAVEIDELGYELHVDFA